MPSELEPRKGGLCHVVPVTYRGQSSVLLEWEPFSYQSKKELCKAQKEFGRGSEYFEGLLKATFSSNLVVPYNLKDLFTCLLSPAEYMLWEGPWKRSLQAIHSEVFTEFGQHA